MLIYSNVYRISVVCSYYSIYSFLLIGTNIAWEAETLSDKNFLVLAGKKHRFLITHSKMTQT